MGFMTANDELCLFVFCQHGILYVFFSFDRMIVSVSIQPIFMRFKGCGSNIQTSVDSCILRASVCIIENLSSLA